MRIFYTVASLKRPTSPGITARHLAAIVMLSALPVSAGMTEEAGTNASANTFDCLMQPSAEVELSAATAGVVSEVLVDRGDRVAKGQVVARLKDEVERTNLAVAELRASTSATQKLRESKLQFEDRRLKRNAGLIADSVLTEKEAEEMRMSREIAY